MEEFSRFEIREYVDEDGNRVKGEVVDVDAEMKGLQSFFQQQQAKVADDKKDDFQKLMSTLSSMNVEQEEDPSNVSMVYM
jgi:uncharacterized protein YajQ (UPF0234 family)